MKKIHPVLRALVACALPVVALACSVSTTPPSPVVGNEEAKAPAQGRPETPAPAPAQPPSSPSGAWGADKCAAAPAGIQSGLDIGKQLAKLTVKDCDGNDYALENVCGASAVWIAVAHGWCPHCQAAAKGAESIVAGYEDKTVAALSILVQNAQSKPPTAADCKAWQKAYGLSNVIALYDPTGTTLELNDDSTTALNVFIDKDRVIRSKSHGESPSLIKAGIDGALAPR